MFLGISVDSNSEFRSILPAISTIIRKNTQRHAGPCRKTPVSTSEMLEKQLLVQISHQVHKFSRKCPKLSESFGILELPKMHEGNSGIFGQALPVMAP